MDKRKKGQEEDVKGCESVGVMQLRDILWLLVICIAAWAGLGVVFWSLWKCFN